MGRSTEPSTEVFNEILALNSVGGDREFLTEIIGLIQAAWPTLLAEIRGGMAMGDIAAVQRSARLAKAAARNVSASRAYECALQLEMMTNMGDLSAAQRAIASLEQEVERLQSVLPAFLTAEYSQ
jgi:HPt (histidine-containing phosphotransfer) domain-containing protein